jgi:homeobox protein cut-like
VKSYQEEIDTLTKRCKASDGVIVDLSKGMADIPDPAPLLSSAVEHLENMSGQVIHLLKGMEEMQHELEVKQKENLQSTKNSDEELSQLRSLLDASNVKNKKLEKELKSANTTSISSKNEISYMSKEEKEELIELRREVAEYEVEFKTLKNQDITIKKLDAKIEDLLANQEEELQRELK